MKAGVHAKEASQSADKVTAILADYVAQSHSSAFPDSVRAEGVRSFVNWLGCVLGGANDPAVHTLRRVLARTSGPPEATVLGHGERLDIFGAALCNGMSNSIRGFNDTHLKTIAHPTASVGAALLALAESRPIKGIDFLHALILGIEIQCRVGNVLMTPPATSHFGLSMVGLVGGIGAAVAVAKALGLDSQRTLWAIGIAGGQAGGLRCTHGTPASHLLSGQAASAGLLAGLLAEEGFAAAAQTLEGEKGFAAALGHNADPLVAIEGLGSSYEILNNTYKPYPCGIVVHPIIDACLDVARAHHLKAEDIERVDLSVSQSALDLCGRRDPPNALLAATSIYHWAAIALRFHEAGLQHFNDEYTQDPSIVALRGRITATAEAQRGADSAAATVILKDGRQFHTDVQHARGSEHRPMTDEELSSKFLQQAALVMEPATARRLLDCCWAIPDVDDVGALVRAFFPVPLRH